MSGTGENSKKFQNVRYKSDAKYLICIAEVLLTPIGIWPLHGGDSFLDNVRRFIHVGIIFCMMCFLMVPHLIYTYVDCEDLPRFMKVIAAQAFSALAIIKFWTIIIRKKKFRDCLMAIEIHYRDVECEEDRFLMKKSAKMGRYFTVLYLSLIYGGALPYHLIVPLVAEKVVREDNTTHVPLPYLSDYVFFVVEDSPLLEIFFVGQMFTSLLILSTNTGAYSLIANCVMHSCCLFQVVSRQMETILEHGADGIHERLGSIIIQHMKAIRYAELIEQTLNIVFLSEMIGCTIVICFLEYGVLMEWEDHKPYSTMMYFILMTSIFVNVFIISYIGDLLKQESARLREVTYFIQWYDLPRRTIKDLIMITIRANRPTTLTAGKLFDVSLTGFCDVCKTSAAYLNFIRTMVS